MHIESIVAPTRLDTTAVRDSIGVILYPNSDISYASLREAVALILA